MTDARRRGKRCPFCRGSDTRPSRLLGLEVLLRVLLLRPYRCRSCGRRFWRFGLPRG